MAAYVAGSREQGGTGNVTFTLPAGWAINDILLLVCESNVGETVAAPTGYTQVTGSPVSATDTQISMFWKRAVSGETAPVITDAGDHIAAHMWLIRDAKTTGDPIMAVATGSETTANATISFASPTASAGGHLAFMATSITRDSDTNPTISASSMTNVEFDTDGEDAYSTAQGAGGGVCALYGLIAGSGAVAGSMTIDVAYRHAKISVIIESADIGQVQLAKSSLGFVIGGAEGNELVKASLGFVVDASGGGGLGGEVVKASLGFVVDMDPPATTSPFWRAYVN